MYDHPRWNCLSFFLKKTLATKWGPQTIAKLVLITPITMVYGTYNDLVIGAYKPTYN